jgi:hypothetical protein
MKTTDNTSCGRNIAVSLENKNRKSPTTPELPQQGVNNHQVLINSS